MVYLHTDSHASAPGGGGADSRPVFTYVERLREQGGFENLKGPIYFAEGYGTYSERSPEYQVIFAFLKEDEDWASVPPWRMKAAV